MEKATRPAIRLESLQAPAGDVLLEADLAVPENAHGIVVFVHGSGSSRQSPRNRKVASMLNESAFATLLFDFLTAGESEVDRMTGHLRFDIELQADRLTAVTDWLKHNAETSGLKLACFGSSTGAAAALTTAARRPGLVRAVVSRSGRPDLAGDALSRVDCPTLLIVGSLDTEVLELNREALKRLNAAEKQLRTIRGAGNLFEEPGTLEQAGRLADDWFTQHLRPGVK